jgi:uncharacterized protein YbbK (DUF523 family)
MGCKVRYNANNLPVYDTNFETIIALHNIVSFCPEVSAGMPIPRPSAEITNGGGVDVLEGQAKVITENGQDQTQDFITAAKNTLAKCLDENIHFAILAESSPSCSSSQIYDGSFNNTKRTGTGVTAVLLEQNGICIFNQYQADDLLALL